MPTYTYKCESCGITYDVFQSIKDEPHKVCPECGGEVKRLIGAGAGIIFKGSGFYVTDYKKQPADNHNKKNGQQKSEPVANNTSNSTKTEANQNKGSQNSTSQSSSSKIKKTANTSATK